MANLDGEGLMRKRQRSRDKACLVSTVHHAPYAYGCNTALKWTHSGHFKKYLGPPTIFLGLLTKILTSRPKHLTPTAKCLAPAVKIFTPGIYCLVRVTKHFLTRTKHFVLVVIYLRRFERSEKQKARGESVYSVVNHKINRAKWHTIRTLTL